MLSFLKPILNFKTLSYFLFYCTGHFFFISSGVRGDSHLPDFKGWSALKLCNKCYLSPIQYLFITPPPISPSSMASTPPYSKPTLSFASSYFRVWQLHLPFLLPIFFSHRSSICLLISSLIHSANVLWASTWAKDCSQGGTGLTGTRCEQTATLSRQGVGSDFGRQKRLGTLENEGTRKWGLAECGTCTIETSLPS